MNIGISCELNLLSRQSVSMSSNFYKRYKIYSYNILCLARTYIMYKFFSLFLHLFCIFMLWYISYKYVKPHNFKVFVL